MRSAIVAWLGGGWAACPAEASVMFCPMETWSRVVTHARLVDHLVTVGSMDFESGRRSGWWGRWRRCAQGRLPHAPTSCRWQAVFAPRDRLRDLGSLDGGACAGPAHGASVFSRVAAS